MSDGPARGPPNRADRSLNDELAEQIRGRKRTGIPGQQPTVADGDDAVDVRDSGRSDLVFHAAGSYLDEGGESCAIA